MGSEDYIEHDSTGILVEPRDSHSLRQAIQRLWLDRELRLRLGQNAERFIETYCSDEAAGASLARVLDEIERERSH
jgi:glycosyltransferase involved in cell wall biosynthesis